MKNPTATIPMIQMKWATFLKDKNPLKLTPGELDTLNRHLSVKEIELTINHLSNLNHQAQVGSLVNSSKRLKKSLLIVFNHFQKVEAEGTLTHSMRPALHKYENQKRYYQKQKLEVNISHKHRGKNPQQNTSKLNPSLYKKITYYDQVRSIPVLQGWVNIHISVKTMHNINRLKKKNHMIVPIYG